jgi:hypothetical protein
VKRRVAEDGRVVHPAGERSGSLSRIGGPSRDGFIAGVAGHSRDSWMFACPSWRVGVHVDDHHLTLRREPRSDRSTDPARAAGHHIGAHHVQAILITGEELSIKSRAAAGWRWRNWCRQRPRLTRVM